ncbi:WD40 repeat-like protein, partial [Polychaeton citri CBS 116435]
EVTALKWNDDSTRILVSSAKFIEVISPEENVHRIRIDNGSGSLGKIQSSAFIGTQLLAVWEFGKAKLWDLETGVGVDLGDLKTTCDRSSWQVRSKDPNACLLAILSRHSAEDTLTLHSPSTSKSLEAVRLKTIDAQGLSWSPDGRWLALLDTPSAGQGVHIYTPSGHAFRSYPPTTDMEDIGLGVKAMIWSGDGSVLALTRFDGKIELLNTRTFTPFAFIEHTTTIDQHASSDSPLSVWQEHVSAANERSYSHVTQSLTPPLSQTRPSTEPKDLGIVEARFSCRGQYLASRDARMLSTVWIWSARSLKSHAVIIQHTNVRRMQWHPDLEELLLLDCGENTCYIWDAAQPDQPPTPIVTAGQGTLSFSWASYLATTIIFAVSRSSFSLLYPWGNPQPHLEPIQQAQDQTQELEEDSLLEVLTGRKPQQEQSYTEQVSIEADAFSSSEHLEDTFVEKSKAKTLQAEVDPLDDSEIF